jgi:aromatic-L-amino-acid/L-tryptophan decarboxylase
MPVLPAVQPDYLSSLIPVSPPQHGQDPSEIQADVQSKIIPGLTNWQHPHFMAFFPANFSFAGLLGDMYSTAFTCAAFNWLCSPAVTELETIVMDWVAEMVGLDDSFRSTRKNGTKGTGGGVIQGSASEAVLTVMVAARERYLNSLVPADADEEEKWRIRGEAYGKLCVLISSEAHSCTEKAAMVLGIRVVKVSVDPVTLAILPDALREKVAELKAKGWHPFFTTNTYGTTSTCAVDPFDEIEEALKDYPEIWKHVDAAYAGSFLVLPEFQRDAAHWARYDSFDFNMHKGLLVPFDCSCLFIRERKHLINALSLTPSYLRNPASESGRVIDYRDWQLPLGRRFRSLKVWFVVRTYGVVGLQKHIRRTLECGEYFSKLVRERPDLFVVTVQERFGLTVVRIKPTEGDDEKVGDSLTKEVARRINEEKNFFITAAVSKGREIIRVVSGSENANEEAMKALFDDMVAKIEAVRKDIGA